MNLVLPRTPAELAFGLTLPHRRMEEWKWTDLRQLIDKPYPPDHRVAAADKDVARLLAASPFAGIAKTRVVFVNGRYDAKRSKVAGLDFAPGIDGIEGDDAIVAMNAAFASDGARLRIEGAADTPIELVFLTTDDAPRTIATRHTIEIVAGASATIIETHLGVGDYLANSVIDISVGPGARLDRIKVEHESAGAIHLAHARVRLEAGSSVRDFTLTSGARVNRQNGTYVFAGEGAEARVSGAYLLAGRQHADTRLVIDHAVPKCTSREVFKCVMDEQARGVFQGKVIVRPKAQKTDGKQSSHALLLSPTAEFDAKPELEIFADDVVCGHGATAGDIDHDHLFYLRSRGIPEPQAKAMLVQAFVAEAFESIGHDGIREALNDFAGAWLTGHRRAA